MTKVGSWIKIHRGKMDCIRKKKLEGEGFAAGNCFEGVLRATDKREKHTLEEQKKK